MNKFYLILILIVFLNCKGKSAADSSANASFIDFSFFGNDKIKIDSTLINSSIDENFKAFYKKYNYETAWNTKEHRDFIINEFSNAENEGLQPKDYELNQLVLCGHMFLLKYIHLLILSGMEQ